MNTCETCARWQRHHNAGPVLLSTGECGLHLPRWLTGTDGPDFAQQPTGADETCDFHQQQKD